MNASNGHGRRDLGSDLASLDGNRDPQLQLVATQAGSANRHGIHLPAQFFKKPVTEKQLNRMSKHINTALKLRQLAAELGKNQSEVEVYIENHRNIVEASFKFLIDWRYQNVCPETAWRNILYALYDAQVFPSKHHLIEFCNALFNIRPANYANTGDGESGGLALQSAPSS